MFGIFLKLGIHHILNIAAYDHILFVVLLTNLYKPSQWKIVLALVTAFTLGHTTSFAIAALGYISIRSAWVEWMIVVTIFLTGIENLLTGEVRGNQAFTLRYWLKYGTAMVFGLIHGLGFASYLQGLLGKEGKWVVPLLSFNLGVEAGQWVVVSLVMILTFVVVNFFRIKIHSWNIIVSAIGITISVILLIVRFPL